MPTEISLPDDFLTYAEDCLDDILGIVGRTATFYYAPKQEECVNCVASPIGGGHPNSYRGGGPIFFPTGQSCPLCNGSGYREKEQSVSLTVAIYFKLDEFTRDLPSTIQNPEGVIEVKGKRSDLQKILQAREMVITLDGQHQRYFLAGEPVDENNLVKNVYFSSFWQRGG